MLRSVLLALDDSASSRAAERLALLAAGECSAEVSASVILDDVWMRGPGDTYRGAATRQRRNEAWALAHQIGSSFQTRARAAGISCSVDLAAAEPASVLANTLVEHDILIIGRNADFRYYGQSDMSSATTRFIRDHIRPVLLVPEKTDEGGPVLVACDGSAAAYRAAQMFALLEIFAQRSVFVLVVDRLLRRAEEIAGQIGHLFERHGRRTELLPIASEAAPVDVLRERAVAIGAEILVMGAFGHHGPREFIFGSCTGEMLDTSPAALLLYG